MLVSLYLPWAGTTANAGFGDRSIVHSFPGSEDISAWSASASTAEAVVALYLHAAGVTAWMRGVRIPISAPALLAAYFALAIAIEARATAMNVNGGAEAGVDFHYARGAYLGIASGVLAVAAALSLRRSTHVRAKRLPVSGLLGPGMAIALLVALLLPWERATFRFEGTSASIEYPGISEPASVVAALAAVWVATAFWSDRVDVEWKRVAFASAAAVFTLGAFGAADPVLQRAYGAWIAVGVALALAALAIVREGRGAVAFLRRLQWRVLALAAVSALFVGSLFLPWRTQSFPRSFAPDPRAGHSVSLNGWSLTGAAAATFAVVLLTLSLRGASRPFHPLALAGGVMLFAGIAAIELTRGSTRQVPVELGYGAAVGLACAAAAIGLAVLLVRFTTPVWREIGARSVPIALCAAYIAVVVIPTLREPSFDRPALFFAPISWLTVAGVVAAILLIQSWVEKSADRARLVVLPLSMLALAVVDVIKFRHDLAWGAAAVVGLCVVLSGLGRIEQRGGFSGLSVPELLRIDRI